LVYQLDFDVEGVWYAIAGTTVIKGLIMMGWFGRGRWERMIGRGSA